MHPPHYQYQQQFQPQYQYPPYQQYSVNGYQQRSSTPPRYARHSTPPRQYLPPHPTVPPPPGLPPPPPSGTASTNTARRVEEVTGNQVTQQDMDSHNVNQVNHNEASQPYSLFNNDPSNVSSLGPLLIHHIENIPKDTQSIVSTVPSTPTSTPPSSPISEPPLSSEPTPAIPTSTNTSKLSTPTINPVPDPLLLPSLISTLSSNSSTTSKPVPFPSAPTPNNTNQSTTSTSQTSSNSPTITTTCSSYNQHQSTTHPSNTATLSLSLPTTTSQTTTANIHHSNNNVHHIQSTTSNTNNNSNSNQPSQVTQQSSKTIRFASTIQSLEFNPTKSTLHPPINGNPNATWYSKPIQICDMNNPHSAYIYQTIIMPTQLQQPLNSLSEPAKQHKTSPQRVHPPLRACIDSAASADMIPAKEYFDTLTYYDQSDDSTPSVMLGDETTLVPVIGYGLAKYSINGKTIRKRALYVPALGKTALLSVNQHMQNQGCYFHAEAHNTILAFPTFMITPNVAKEIDVQLHISTEELDFDELTTQQIAIKQLSTEHPKKLFTTHQQQYNFEHKDVNSYPIQKESKTVYVQKLSPQAQLPARSTPGSIGFDVTATTTITIQPNEIKPIPTGLATSFPSDIYLRIASRSSMAMKQVIVQGGVVDSDYRGEIQVLLHNQSLHPITIPVNSKIAQFIFEKADIPLLQQVPSLPNTMRGTNGFGSTNDPTDIPHHNQQGLPNSRIQTFRLDDNNLLIMDKSKKSTAKRVSAPIQIPLVHPNDLQYWNHPSRAKDQNLHNELVIHPMNSDETTKVDPILQMNIKQISSDPADHNVLPSTDLLPPTITPVYRPNSSQASFVTMSNDDLSKSIGFLKTDKLIKNMKFLGKNNFSITKLPRNPTLDPGETATQVSAPRNTSPSPTPSEMRKIWHIDIGFGPCNAIGGIKYTLLAVNKKTRTNLVFGLKNLTTSLHRAMQEFILVCGPKPEIIRTDFDAKLIRGPVKKFLTEQQIKIQASPPYRQHQNGLIERHWQTVVCENTLSVLFN